MKAAMATATVPAALALDLALDPQALRHSLQRALPEARQGVLVVEQVQVGQVRRNTSVQRNPHPLTAVLDVALRRVADGACHTARFYAKAYRGGASAVVPPGPATVHVPALDLRLWPWPADPGLPQLPDLLRPEQTLPFWGRPAASVRVLRHTPEHRATLRYGRTHGAAQGAADAPEAEDATDSLYAKTFCDGRGSQVLARFAHVWSRAQADADAPTVAEPLAYDAATRTLWQAAARGTPLLDLLGHPGAPDHPGSDGALAERVAAAWATLHAAPPALAGPARRDTAHWLAEVARRRRKIGRIDAGLAARADATAQALADAAARLSAAAPAFIHGDCHPEQLWLQRGRVVLFDFDECALGDPMEDLANFVVRLAERPGAAAWAEDLVAAYARHAPRAFDRSRLRWHQAVQTLLQASRAFVFQAPGWRTALDARLARAHALAIGL